MSDVNRTEFVGWPVAVRVLGHAGAQRAVRDGHLTVYQYNGARLVRRDVLVRLRPHEQPLGRRRGDGPPLFPFDLGQRR